MAEPTNNQDLPAESSFLPDAVLTGASLKWVPVETTLSLTRDYLADSNPEVTNIIDTIQSDPELLDALNNLKNENPQFFRDTLEKITTPSGEEGTSASLEGINTALQNDVIRGQITQITNNIADNENITDEHLTELQAAGDAYKNTVEGMSLTGKFTTAVLGVENQDLLDATQRLTKAYTELGMTEADAKVAIAEGWKIGANQAIGGIDNFGSHISGFVNTMMFDLGPLMSMLGIDKILAQLGIEFEGGLADLLGEDVANTIQSYVTPATDWAEENMNFNVADKVAPHITSRLPGFIEENITASVGIFEADAPATTGNVVDFPTKFNEATTGVTVMTPEQIRETMVSIDPKLSDEMQGIQADADLKAQFDKFGSMTKEDAQREAAELQTQLANPEVTIREAVAGIGTPGM